jgi:hypothetical protein
MEKERGRQTCVADDIAGFGGYAFPPVTFTGLGERWMAMERKEEGGLGGFGSPAIGGHAHGFDLDVSPIRLPCLSPRDSQRSLSWLLGAGGSVCSSRQHVVGSGFLPSPFQNWEAFGCVKSSKTLYLPSIRVARHKNETKKVQIA